MAVPACGETTCQPIAGTSFSHFLGTNCQGTEYHYTNYHGADQRPYSWDGQGLGGTQMLTANPLSYKDTNGFCINRLISGDLSGLLRVYRCPLGEVSCSGTCVAGQCCIDADCPKPANGSVVCGGHLCDITCDPGYSLCGGACIPAGSCCTAADCTTPDVCHKLPATCSANTCQYTPNDGALCDADGTKCTPNDRCQSGTCQADTANAVKCVAKDCNSASCNPTTGNCDYVPTSGGACGTTGCYTAGTCSAGACSGTPKDCSAVSTSTCTVPACDADTGACTVENVPNDTPCSLPDKCLENVGCSGGVCVGSPKVCVPSSSCAFAECNPSDGSCSESALAAGTPCAAADSCSLDGVCGADGRCQGTQLPDGTPCERKMSCATGEPASCAAGRCRCPGEVDVPDLGTAPDGGMAPPEEHGCAMGGRGEGNPVAVVMLMLIALAARRRRRQFCLGSAERAAQPCTRGCPCRIR